MSSDRPTPAPGDDFFTHASQAGEQTPPGTGDETQALTRAFQELDAAEKHANNRPHKLSVKQVIGIMIAVGVAPIVALWGFELVG